MAVKKTQTSIDERLLLMLEAKDKQMTLLMEKLLDQVTETARAQRGWLELFKPPQQPTKSTTPDERDALRENEKLWTELDANEMLRLGPMVEEDDGEF
jgi:hypothetical protein